MAAETAAIREKTRKVKNHILDRYLKLVELDEGGRQMSEYEKNQYNELTLTFARNVLPRAQEISGEDGEKLEIKLVSYADNIGQIPTPPLSNPDNQGV